MGRPKNINAFTVIVKWQTHKNVMVLHIAVVWLQARQNSDDTVHEIWHLQYQHLSVISRKQVKYQLNKEFSLCLYQLLFNSKQIPVGLSLLVI